MARLRPYHFARLQPAGFRAFSDAVRGVGGAVCFDLEDSVFDPDPVRCRTLKARRRRDVLALLRSLGDALDPAGTYVRLNAPGTDDHRADVEALQALGPRTPGLFVPKLERADDLVALAAAFPTPPPDVIPVIESRTAFAALPALLAAPVASFRRLAFGHCDYNLDCGCFPFHHQDAEPYWTWMGRLGAAARSAGKGLLNSPVLGLDDPAALGRVLDRLRDVPSAEGQITLSMSQTRQTAAHRAVGAAPRPAAPPPALSGRSVRDAARQVVRAFERHRVDGGFFALDRDRRLISPQEYRAALHVLQP